MSLTISGASSAAHPLSASVSAQPAKAEPNSDGSSGFTSKAGANKSSALSQQQQQPALNRLLAKYKAALARGESGGDLASLSKQIAAAAKALGQHVSLPKASAGITDSESTAGSLAQSPGDQPTEANKSKVNLSA